MEKNLDRITGYTGSKNYLCHSRVSALRADFGVRRRRPVFIVEAASSRLFKRQDDRRIILASSRLNKRQDGASTINFTACAMPHKKMKIPIQFK
jgi:hypothetical protein